MTRHYGLQSSPGLSLDIAKLEPHSHALNFAAMISVQPLEYDRAQTQRQFDDTPGLARRMLLNRDALKNSDIYSIFATRKIEGERDEIFALGQWYGGQVSDRLAQAPMEFRACLTRLATQVQKVLQCQSDALALEHEAILFWPSLSDLHDFLGIQPRVDELIVAFDLLRSAFQTRPVTVQALSTLENVLQAAAVTQHYTTEQIDAWVDRLAEAGLDLQFPLSTEPLHAA